MQVTKLESIADSDNVKTSLDNTNRYVDLQVTATPLLEELFLPNVTVVIRDCDDKHGMMRLGAIENAKAHIIVEFLVFTQYYI